MIGPVEISGFAEDVMITQHFAVIRGENDQGLIILSMGFQPGDQAPHLGIHFGNHGKINRPQDGHFVGFEIGSAAGPIGDLKLRWASLAMLAARTGDGIAAGSNNALYGAGTQKGGVRP